MDRTDEAIGVRIIEAVCDGRLMDVSCPDAPDSGCLIVWRQHAAEQIGALAKEYAMAEKKASPTDLMAAVLRDAAREAGIELQGSLTEVSNVLQNGAARLALAVGQEGYDRALQAELDSTWLALSRRTVESADAKDLQVVSVVRGLLAAASVLA